jgi:AraC-like DNA-binding protein
VTLRRQRCAIIGLLRLTGGLPIDYPEHGTQFLEHDDERESWTFALRASMPSLRGLVQGYCLYEERRSATTVHQHLPHAGITFIIGLGGHIEVEDPSGGHCRVEPGQGVLAGLHTAPARTHSKDSQREIQIDLGPLAAHLLLDGLPMDELQNRALSMEELLGREGRELGHRLAETRDSSTAFDLIDAFLEHRLHNPKRTLPEGLAFAWGALTRSHGRTRIAEISDELGWSRRRLVEAFRNSVGLTPKALARVLRFDRAMTLWKVDPSLRWADIAFDTGYHDQAHFSREVRALSGQTPSELAQHLLPESGGMTA